MGREPAGGQRRRRVRDSIFETKNGAGTRSGPPPATALRDGATTCRLRQKKRRTGKSASLNPDSVSDQDQRRSTRESGIWRTRLPVAAKIALQMAGATGGRAGSPSPVVGYLVERKCVSILSGASVMRISG